MRQHREALAGEKGSAAQRKYIPEQQAEPVKAVGPAVSARYSAGVPCAPVKAGPREGAANRGGTANFRPLPNSVLAGGFFCPLPPVTRRKHNDTV